MELSIEDLENPLKIFSAQISLVESYINDIICIEEPEAKLTCSVNDFELLDQLIHHAYIEDTPEDVRESMIQGVVFAFSEILTRLHEFKWCVVSNGPFPGVGMRLGDSEKVVHLRDIVDKHIEETEDISFSKIYEQIVKLLELSNS